MVILRDWLRERGISLRSYEEGGRKTLCPKCSARRSRAHQKEPCLYVKITDQGCGFHCFNCGWAEGVKKNGEADRGGYRMGRKAKNQRAQSGSVRRGQRYDGFWSGAS